MLLKIIKQLISSAKCETPARAHDAFFLLTRAGMTYDFPITLSNYKRDGHTAL